MKAAYDETLATALKRKHEPQRFVGGHAPRSLRISRGSPLDGINRLLVLAE